MGDGRSGGFATVAAAVVVSCCRVGWDSGVLMGVDIVKSNYEAAPTEQGCARFDGVISGSALTLVSCAVVVHECAATDRRLGCA